MGNLLAICDIFAVFGGVPAHLKHNKPGTKRPAYWACSWQFQKNLRRSGVDYCGVLIRQPAFELAILTSRSRFRALTRRAYEAPRRRDRLSRRSLILNEHRGTKPPSRASLIRFANA